MSEPAVQNRRKVSREGVVLLKSFEGFRARAERDGDGWVIGYGHRKSARAGLTVGEADAELLLQYDLLPVVAALNDLPVALNAHQFDALASFAFSVGVERFRGSDVHARLAEDRPEAAAEALLAWNEPAPATAGLRRRAAERALFLTDPERPVALSDLLAAPLPQADPGPDPADARAAAVAALLGDAPRSEAPDSPHATPDDVADEAPVVVPSFAPPATAEPEGGATAPMIPHWGMRYGATVVGPLPGFPSPAQTPAPAPAVVIDPAPAPLPEIRTSEAALSETIVSAPAADDFTAQGPVETAAFESPTPIAVDWPAPTPTSFPAPPVQPLVLTPAPEDEPQAERPVWGEDQRAAPASVAQEPLFVDAPSQVSILRHEEEPAEARRFDWSETGMYVIMGGLGLVSCAVSAAAFRVAVEDPSPMGETTAVAWTLAVIGAVCVGAASWHLYVRTTRRKA